MDPQAPIVPEIPKVENPERVQRVERDNHWITIASMAIFVLLSLGAVAFLYYQNQQLKQMLAAYQTPSPSFTPTAISKTTSTTSPMPSASPGATSTKPVVTSPKPGTKVASPLTVTGTVPAGWMFEGVFPIKLVDKAGNLIVQGQAKEKVPGSWQSGNPVDFTATLAFTTTEKNGFIVLENANPSGDPANAKTFEVPVTF